jgi:hypothetical protein
MIEATEPEEPIDATDPIEPIDSTETAEPIDPMDSTEPTEPMDSTELWLAIERTDPDWSERAIVATIMTDRHAAPHDAALCRDALRADGIDRALLCISSPLGIETLPRAEAQPLVDAWHEGVFALGDPFDVWSAIALDGAMGACEIPRGGLRRHSISYAEEPRPLATSKPSTPVRNRSDVSPSRKVRYGPSVAAMAPGVAGATQPA